MSIEQKTPLVSVVVASYNHVEYLEQRMNSLINQTYDNIEIIVIDDKSTDGSATFLKKYADNQKVKLIIREENGGWVKVSNQGVSLARGSYVLFANCDDSCDSQMIERLVQGMIKNPTAGISFCRSLLIDEKGTVIGNDFSGRERKFRETCNQDTLIDKSDMSRFLLESCVIPNLSAALIKKTCFAAVGGFNAEYRVCSDWHLFFRIVTSNDVAYIAEPLNLFRQHETTIRSETKEKVIYDEIIRLLLVEIRKIDLSLAERVRFRAHVMYLWSLHLVRPSMTGLLNFRHHLVTVLRLDSVALLLLPVAVSFRILQVPVVLIRKLSKIRKSNAV